MRLQHASFESPSSRRYVIADIGGNHGGSLSKASVAIATCGHIDVDAVKFQLFRPCDVLEGNPSTEPSIPLDWLPELRRVASHHGMDFLCTPFSEWAVRELDEHVDVWKVGSFEADGAPFVSQLIPDRRPLIVSLGMAQGERKRNRIRGALLKRPWLYRTVVCHCVSEYPTPLAHTRAHRISRADPFIRGYSSHTTVDADVMVAVALGAMVVEKHIKFVYSEGPDTGIHALGWKDFQRMVRRIRQTEACLEDNQFAVKAPEGRIVWKDGSVVQ